MTSIEHHLEEHSGRSNGLDSTGMDEKHTPWNHIIGFSISLVLTVLALWMVLHHIIHAAVLFGAIMALAILQAFVQLYFFMHITEHHVPQWPFHVWMLTLGVTFTILFVVASIWIMSFGAESY